MTTPRQGGGDGNGTRRSSTRWQRFIASGCLGVILLAILIPQGRFTRAKRNTAPDSSSTPQSSSLYESSHRSKPVPTPEEIVTTKVGQFARVGQLYAELSAMDLEQQRKEHYARASKRYAGVRDEPIDATPLPSHLRQDNHFPDVWHVDLLEWEQQGSAAEACADVLLDKRWPDLIRRKALLARLTAFAVEGRLAR
jgi:hypothetical protein